MAKPLLKIHGITEPFFMMLPSFQPSFASHNYGSVLRPVQHSLGNPSFQVFLCHPVTLPYLSADGNRIHLHHQRSCGLRPDAKPFSDLVLVKITSHSHPTPTGYPQENRCNNHRPTGHQVVKAFRFYGLPVFFFVLLRPQIT